MLSPATLLSLSQDRTTMSMEILLGQLDGQVSINMQKPATLLPLSQTRTRMSIGILLKTFLCCDDYGLP
jgi:hypothetical protein